jgi:rubrerythrin
MSSEVAQEVYRVLTACRFIELTMAGFYEELAVLHQDDAAMANLWKKTAREEMNHAAQFSLLIDTMSDTVSAALTDPATLDRVRRAIENTIEEYRLRLPSAREALVAAIDFEESMSSLHADQVLVFTHSQCKHLLAAMMAADRGHVSTLRAALSKLNQPKF